MKMVKSLLLGGAAGLLAVAGAQAADLPVKAKPVQYVKICSLYGAGFYYMPGTDTCLKVGGYVRAEANYNAGGSFAPIPSAAGVTTALHLNNRNQFQQDWRTRAAITLDARSQTEYGTLRSYLLITATDDNSGAFGSTWPAPSNTIGASGYNRLYAPTAFIQFAGFTAGKTASFFDFDTQAYSNQSNLWGSNNGGNGVELFAYTAQFGNGLSASIAAENADGHRNSIFNGNPYAPAVLIGAPATTNTTGYANEQMPDVVGNLRIDQAWGSAQVMGALHQVRAQDSTAAQAANISDHPGDKLGFALGAGLKLNAPMLGKGDYVMGQFTYAEGATDYVGSGLPMSFAITTEYPYTTNAVAPVSDAVWNGGATGSMDLTKSWSITGGFEHFWNPQWKSSIWGSYGKLEYSDASSTTIRPANATAGSSANWSLWQIGSRTTWTPVQNLDLSVEVMYVNVNTAFAGPTYADKNWVAGMFRVQRNFYP